MKKKVLRTLAVLLIFSICTSLLPASVLAVPAEESVGEKTPTMVDFIAGTATAEDIYGVLDASIVPAAIDYNEAVEKNHIARCYEDEGTDLNKIVFLNIDGTKTMYAFDFPVKYVDDNGNIQDIRLEIADSAVNAGEFETAANDTVTTFSAQFTDGIALEGNDTEIRLIPILPSANLGMTTISTTDMTAPTATAQRVDEDTVAYPYDAKTTVEYSLTYTGFKEDIVVSEYTGQTTYPFRLLTNGLALEEIGGSYFLMDDQGNIEASIGDIIIYTADERNNTFGDIEPKTIVENQEYLLNIVVDAEYLADPATTYPIRIDPTIEIKYSNNGAGAVEDITISTNTNFAGTYGSLYVGRRSTEGIARILMRFPALDVSSLSGATVTSATVRVRDLMCESTSLNVSCHVFTGSIWDGSYATWANSNPNGYVATPLSTNTLSWSIGNAFSSKHWYTFDVTSAVQGWIDEYCNQSMGLMFKVDSSVENGSTVNNRTFGSYNRSSYQPSLTVTYQEDTSTSILANGNYYLNNRGSGKYLQLTASGGGACTSGLLSTLGSSIQWELKKVEGHYVIRSVADSTKYVAAPASSSSLDATICTVNGTAIPQSCYWTITNASGGDYLIQNVAYGTYLYSAGASLRVIAGPPNPGSTLYEQAVWRIVSTAAYGDTSAYSTQQMTDTVSISNMECSVGDIIDIHINKVYTNELWCEATDFTYTFSNVGVVSFNNGTLVVGDTLGATMVTATHKVTGRTKSFYVIVGYSSTISATPFPQTIVDGLNMPYSVWPAEAGSSYYLYDIDYRVSGLTGIYAEAVAGVATFSLIYPAASTLLNHYLGNTGEKYTIDFQTMIDECSYAASQRAIQINQLMRAAEVSASYNNKTLRTMESYDTNSIPSDQQNWYLALGKYYTSISGVYHQISATTYTMTVTYELHDCYDWERSTVTSVLGLVSNQMWELHYGGFAKNYEVYGINTFTITWTYGQEFAEELISNET